MATTTTNFGWDIPQSTDLVKDGATAIAALGQDIDTALVDLKGGTTGQVLAKQTGTDLDFTWTTIASIAPSALTKISGRYYRSNSANASAVASQAAINNRTYYTPIHIPASTSVNRIAIVTGATFSGTATVRLGIYNDTNGLPSTVLVDGGTVSCTTLNTAYEVTISQTLAAGWYWLAANSQVNATTNTYNGVTTSTSNIAYTLGDLGYTTLASGFTSGMCYTQDSVSGAFATAGTLTLATATILPAYKVA